MRVKLPEEIEALAKEAFHTGWGWYGVPQSIKMSQIKYLSFLGNLVFTDSHGYFWRLCPEHLLVQRLYPSNLAGEVGRLVFGDELDPGWRQLELRKELGIDLHSLNYKSLFGLITPIALGGKYKAINTEKISLDNIIIRSGELAKIESEKHNKNRL